MELDRIEHNGNESLPVKEEVKSSSEHIMNGLSNGISSKSDGQHKHKHKDKDRHSDKHKHKDKDRDRDRENRSSKDKHSSEKNKSERRDKEHRDREKDRSKDKEHRSKDKESHSKVKEYDKNKENRDKEHKSKDHSSEKHRDSGHKSRDEKHSSSSSSKSHSSSSKDKDKHHSSSSSNNNSKDKRSSDKHKDKHSSSSSSKHSSDRKSIPSSSEKSKHRDSPAAVKVESFKDSPMKREDDEVQFRDNAVKSEQFSDNEADENVTYDSSMNIKKESSYMYDESSVKMEETDPLDPFGQDEDSEDSIPLAKRASLASKRKSVDSDSEEDIPLSARKKLKKEEAKKRKKHVYSDEEDSDMERRKPNKSKVKKEPKKEVKRESRGDTSSPTKRKKKEEEQQTVWKWWEEEKKDDGVKWKFLEHKGPMFAPPYERLPKEVKFYYNGKEMRLSQDAEEIATFYARLIEHEYTTKEQFNKNFFKDWRKSMTSQEREVITDLSKCNFRPMYEYFLKKSEERKAMSKEEKKKIKEENEEIAKIYGICTIDGHQEKIGNFKIEPPGLFRGRGEHPKMGMLKKRVMPEDVIINCSKDSKRPTPPEGHKWKEIRHDNTVTWLASWTENVQGQVKYVMLNPSSKLKGEKDWQKYETARKLAKCVDKIRQDYREDWKSKEMRIRQRAVAMYFIDKLALRAGNEKDEDQADTVGCCSLRLEHIQLHDQLNGKENVVVFDFLGKDSIRYYNEVEVEKRVFKNLKLFCEKKKGTDDLFDRLNTSVLNKHLNELMEGLTAKVFRTYNASITLQSQLDELTDPDSTIPEKILQYNRANRAVAILCNHQRAVPKSHEKSMGNLKNKIDAKKEQISDAQKQYKEAKREAKNGSASSKVTVEKKKKALDRLKEQLLKLEVQETDKEENKQIALGTSKLNYLDPRISVAWCKKYDVPIEKIYNKTQRAKFAWAIDMAGPDFVF